MTKIIALFLALIGAAACSLPNISPVPQPPDRCCGAAPPDNGGVGAGEEAGADAPA